MGSEMCIRDRTKLGNLLFCLTVEGIHEKNFMDMEIERPLSEEGNSFTAISPVRREREEEQHSVTVFDSPLCAIPSPYRRNNMISTPCLNTNINKNFSSIRHGMHNKLNTIRDFSFDTTLGVPSKIDDNWAVMYIDDLSIGEVIDQNTAISCLLYTSDAADE